MAVVLTLGVTGCGGSDSSSPQAKPTPSSPATTRSGVVLAPNTKPTQLAIGKVAGRLNKHDRTALEHRVGAVVDSWIDGGFIRGDYPRTRLAAAYVGFTRAAAQDARQRSGLMTIGTLGKKISAVVATTRKVRLDVLAPHGTIAATTARVLLRFETSGKVRTKEVVRGRLFLTRDNQGSWKIFGFDISKGRA